MSAENKHTTKLIPKKNYFCRYFFLLVLYASPHVREYKFRKFSHLETGTYLSGRGFIHRAVKIWNSLPDNIVAL